MKKRILTIIFGIVAMIVFAFGLSACKKDISFQLNFVVDDVICATIDTSGDEVISLPDNPTKENYTFDGWYWDKDAWQKPFTANSLLDAPLSSDMSVYAKFILNTINGIAFEDVETTYDGTEKSIAVSNLPDGAKVVYDKANTYTNVGEYTVTATISQENHVDLRLTATLKINKAVYDMSGVVFADKTVTYNGESHSIVASNLPDGVSVIYENNEKVNVGSYTIAAKFTGDSKNYEAIPNKTATLTIEKVNVEKPLQNNTSFAYNGKEQTYTITENDNYVIQGNKQTDAGNYTVKISLKDKNNYQWKDKTTEDITYPFKINKAVYNMSGVVFVDKTVTYNGESYSITASNLPDDVSVTYENNGKVNAGSYTVIAKFTGDSKNYEAIPNKKATLTILNGEFKGLSFESKSFTYDGLEKKIEVTGIPSGATVTYDKPSTQINAGEYTIKATIKKQNYSDVTLTATLTINKATYDMSGVTFENRTVTYSGETHSILAQNVPNGLSVFYLGNGKINADTYTVTAIFTDTTGNYVNPENKTATLVINKANVTGISFTNKTFTYNGNNHSLAITGKLPDGVSVTYVNNDKINAGMYTVTARFKDNSGNYIVPDDMTAKLIIDKATVSGITFENRTYTYNGEKRSIAISGTLPDEITVSYVNNGKTNAGTYTVTATFTCDTDNYVVPDDMAATLTIKKAVYDMSSVSFENQTVTYDGNSHDLSISGALPTGVTVSYANNNQTNANQYIVVASFMGDAINYYAIDDMQAMLTINKATYDMSGVSFVGDRFTYDGTSKYIYISGNLPDGVSVTYANNGKINANTYTVTAKFAGDTENHNLIPDLTATLIIDKANYDMSGIVFNGNTFKYDGTIHSISISGNLPDGVSVSYKNNDQIEKGEYVVAAQFVGDENYNKPDDICATLIITREEHTLTFKQDGQKDKICKVLDLADFTDIPSVTYVKGYKVVWEEKNYKKITSDMEINAIITLESYTITYHLFDGENALKNPSVYTVLDDIELKSAEKTGYTFKGWYTDGSFNDKIENLSDIAGNLDLYARFVPNTYTATFEHDVTLTLVAKGKRISYIMKPKDPKTLNLYSTEVMRNFLSDSYNGTTKDPCFLGWYYDSNFTEKVEQGYIGIETNTVLYGKFGEVNNDAFLLKTTIPSGYFQLWPNNSDWSGYKNYFYYTAPTLYEGSVKVNFEYVEGDSRYPYQIVGVFEYDASRAFNPYVTVFSYKRVDGFISWEVKPGRQYVISVCATDDLRDGAGSTTDYGKFVCTVQFSGDRRGQSARAVCVQQEVFNYDENISVSPLNIPTGYSFSKWIDENGVEISDVWNYTSDKVFTPVWNINHYKINYVLDGGTNSSNNPDSYTIQDTVTFSQASKKGYSFNGWYTDARFTNKVTSISGQTGNITLYALFAKNDYELQLNGNGGKWGNTITFIDGNEIIKSELLIDDTVCDFRPNEKQGYIFGGWYSDKDLLNPYNFDATITSDLVLYAKWYSVSDSYNRIDIIKSLELSLSIQGKTEQRFYFSPIADGQLTVTSVSNLDLHGALYDENGNLLTVSDDISDSNLDFSFDYSVKAGKLYYFVIKANTVSSIGDAKIQIDWTGNVGVKSVTYTERTFTVPYEQEIDLPTNLIKDGFTFVGWFDENGNEYQSGNWDYAKNIVLYAKWIENN